MPSGLIEIDEIFHVFIEDTKSIKDSQVFYYEMKNSPQKEPEKITMNIMFNLFFFCLNRISLSTSNVLEYQYLQNLKTFVKVKDIGLWNL